MSAPFVWILVCLAAGILSSRFVFVPAWILLPGILVATASFLCRFRIAVLANAVLMVLIAASYTQKLEESYNSNPLRTWALSHSKEVVLFRGVILRTPEISGDYFVLHVRVETISGAAISGVARIAVSGPMNLHLIAGDRIESFGKFRNGTNFQTDGAFDYDRYLRSEGIHVLGNVKNAGLIRVIGKGKGVRSFFSAIRLRFVLKTSHSFPVRDGGILRALWLDDRGALSQSDQQIMMDAGIFHVIAISGFHITVLLFLLFLVLRKWVSFRFAVLAGCILLTGYFFVLEGRASVTRSFLSFLIFGFAVWRHEQISLGNWICLSAMIQLTLNPLEIYDPGFHLTYLSTASILFLIVPISRMWIKLRKIYQVVLNFFATGVVLQIVLLPYQVYVFHRIPFHSVFANIIAVPVSSILIALSALFLPLPVFSTILRPPIHTLVDQFLTSAGFFADRGARIFPSPPLVLVICFYFTLTAFVISSTKRRKMVFLAIAMVLLVGVFQWPGPDPQGILRIHMLDVGQGDSILLEFPDGTADLIDAGGFFNSDALDTGQSIVIPYLCKKRITRLNRVFLTHAHADHMNGLGSILKYVPVNALYVTRQPYGDRGYQHFLASVSRSPIPICRGKTFTQGDVRIDVLAPEDTLKTRKVRNDDSLVLLLRYQNQRILLTGDIEAQTERQLAEQLDFPIDYFKVPHHGSRTSSSELLLDRLKPKVAFASVGPNNWFGHPHPDVLNRFRSRHIVLYRTDRHGTIVLSFFRGGAGISTKR